MFIDFSIKDLIDILLVAYLLYQTYRLMKDSGSINIFTGILVFIGIWLIVSQVLEMKLLGSICGENEIAPDLSGEIVGNIPHFYVIGIEFTPKQEPTNLKNN